MPQEEEQGSHVCSAGGEISPLWNQDGVADALPHLEPQVREHTACTKKSDYPRGDLSFAHELFL